VRLTVGFRVRPLDSRGGSGSGFWTEVHPDLFASLGEVIQGLVVLRIDHVLDVAGHFPEEEDPDNDVQQVRLQGDKLFYQDRGLFGPQAQVDWSNSRVVFCAVLRL